MFEPSLVTQTSVSRQLMERRLNIYLSVVVTSVTPSLCFLDFSKLPSPSCAFVALLHFILLEYICSKLTLLIQSNIKAHVTFFLLSFSKKWLQKNHFSVTIEFLYWISSFFTGLRKCTYWINIFCRLFNDCQNRIKLTWIFLWIAVNQNFLLLPP